MSKPKYDAPDYKYIFGTDKIFKVLIILKHAHCNTQSNYTLATAILG